MEEINEPKGKGELEEKKSIRHLSGFYVLLHHPRVKEGEPPLSNVRGLGKPCGSSVCFKTHVSVISLYK